ncbi:DUF4038 domain-containing protein [Enterococcus avium]|uniref:apiosidase-like domain-containing protein n=1 Tax=Enterococcus avium TaxID=33945 RepID=UPI0025B03A3C|nr:DUF4038 domain-containing protein [Enterococcus avium]MDN2638026.1 DUF4038 domain-containing protein [Enterococcus avium]
MRITVNEDQRTLSRDGEPFFYLADTLWSAFTSIKEDDWLYYLRKRKEQGFNTVQINILPQFDRSVSTKEILPFEVDKNGRYNFEKINKEYFIRAEKLCRIADKMGFSLSLVVLWSTYVEGTWVSKFTKDNIYPEHLLESYFELVLEHFDQFNPIYFISGDTDFPTSKTIEIYMKTLRYFRQHSKQTLKALHIIGRMDKLPEELALEVDLYLYQSGHNHDFLEMPYKLAETFFQYAPKKPVINSEPCYEQMGYSGHKYGRFNQTDVRRTAWQSILSGSTAGITYGAHGVWSWETIGSTYLMNIGEAFDMPLLWQDALHFPGAWDYGYIKNLLEIYKVTSLEPANELLVDMAPDIRLAKSNQGHYFIYLPKNTRIKVSIDMSTYTLKMIDLANGRFVAPRVEFNDGETHFLHHSCEEDVLIISEPK